ncbi:MAG: helix-turn-helix transcriptional regulator [Myxococcota bacterium]
MRLELKQARLNRGWSQRELGERAGLPQVHVSWIETGRVAPRYDTLLDLVRVLDHDLILVPRALVPGVNALLRDYHHQSGDDGRSAEALYIEDTSNVTRADWEAIDET